MGGLTYGVRVFVRVVAVMLALAMWPALSETVELVAHVAAHRDLPHVIDHTHDNTPLGQDEHGCSGAFHLCACQHSPPIVARAFAAPFQMAPAPTSSSHPAPSFVIGRGPAPPPTRPPIA